MRRPQRAARPIPEAPLPSIGHNGGPPLDDHVPAWGSNGIGTYFQWKAATERAFNKVPDAIAVRRARKAAELGLSYREYTLEILERGRYLQPSDTAVIEDIKRRRRRVAPAASGTI